VSSSSSSDREPSGDSVEIGRVVRVHGLQGQLVIRTFADDPKLLLESEQLTLDGTPGCIPFPARGQQPLRQLRDGCWLVRLALAGLDRREQAERWVGAGVRVPLAALEAARGEDLYWRDVIGMECLRPDGTSLGRVVEIWPRPGQDLLRVEGSEGSVWIPAADELLQRVHLESRQLVVDLPEEVCEES